jgi:hypothetical protein
MSEYNTYPAGHEGWGFKVQDTVRAVRDAVVALSELRRNGVPALSSSRAALRLAAESLRRAVTDVDAFGVEFRALLVRLENAQEAAGADGGL